MSIDTVLRTILLPLLLTLGVPACDAEAQGPRPARQHRITQSEGQPDLAAATQRPPARSSVSISIEDGQRVIRANGIPDHLVGAFPNGGNPHAIRTQTYVFRIPTRPALSGRITPLRLQDFGIALNGVPFDPGAAEWYQGDRQGGWQYEALSGAIRPGFDDHHAHVQPSGAYHYHGLPRHLLDELGVVVGRHSPLVGWAADGFPIYALFGFTDGDRADSPVRELRSSYRLKAGRRPSGGGAPGGTHDGTFVADYEYVAGHGDLDECNGRRTVTPDFPKGMYAYFLTSDWPVIPRCFQATPSKYFERTRPRSGQRRRLR
ncbi:MAG: YHYH protein [Acidobacteriota bacterium]